MKMVVKKGLYCDYCSLEITKGEQYYYCRRIEKGKKGNAGQKRDVCLECFNK